MSATLMTIVGVLKHQDGSLEYVTLTGFGGPSVPPLKPSHPDIPAEPTDPIGPSHPDVPPPGPEQQ